VRNTLFRGLLLAVLLGVCAGAQCNRKPDAPPIPTKAQSKVEFFTQTQKNTNTPHGKIDMNSVQETADGVEYRTADGRHWKVVLERTPTGWRVRGDPEEIK
jgi:hypothetical protein